MYLLKIKSLVSVVILSCIVGHSQDKLNLEAIYNSSQYRSEYQNPIFWISNGDSYITISTNEKGENELIEHRSKNNRSRIFLSSEALTPKGAEQALEIESFS